MGKKLLDYIRCPKCKAGFRINGGLFCSGCGEKYKIFEGIPVLINLDNLDRHLLKQIKYFENEGVISKSDYNLCAWQESYLKKFEENFKQIDGKVIIDCGTGSGYMAVELAKRGAFIIGCDLTLKSLIRLKKISEKMKLSDRMIFVCCSAENLPFKNNIADCFISNAVLEHLPKEKSAIKEIHRVTSDDSMIMITVPVLYRYLNPLLILINYIQDKRIGHLRRYSPEILEKKLDNFILLKTYYTGHFQKVLKTAFNFLFNIFDEKKIERDDANKQEKKWWSSNLICFFKKNRHGE